MKLTLPRAIMLDLDDTIIANETLKKECWNRVEKEFSVTLKEIGAGRLISSILKHSDVFWSDAERHRVWRQSIDEARREIVKETFSDLRLPDNGLAEKIADRFSAVREEAMHPFPSAIETVGKFRERGVLLALVTNGNAAVQRRKIERFGLSGLFNHIFIEGEQGYGKPDERIYLKALTALGTRPAETWMIGDNPVWDVFAPQKLGIKGIWVNAGGDEERLHDEPFLTISTLSEIMDHVQ